MDYNTVARELVRALRGKRSQTAVNRRLGRKSNAMHAWERGFRAPSSTDFFRLAQVSGVELRPLLQRLTPCSGETHRELLVSFLQTARRDFPVAELAEQLGVNRNTLARWSNGATEPRLPELLAYIQATTRQLLDFIAGLVPAEEMPSLRKEFDAVRAQRELAYGTPWTYAVLLALQLRSYRRLAQHDDGYVADATGLPRDEVSQCIQLLARAGQIRRRAKLWRVVSSPAVDTRADPKHNLRLKQHWSSVADERLKRQGIPPDGLYSYNVFAVSEDGLDRIRQAHLDYYERLRGIVENTQEPTRVVIANIQLVPLDAPPG